MNPWPVDARGRTRCTSRGPATPTWPASQKYGFTDVRNVLERASARETAARVAAGALAKAFLRALGVERPQPRDRRSAAVDAPAPRATSAPATSTASTSRPCAASTRDASAAMVEEIDAARKANESLGGVFEVRAFGLVPGLGSHVSWEERLDGRLAQAIMSIQAIKGVGDRRRLRGRRARRARRRTTRSSGTRSAASTARPTAPAASRAA